MLPADLHVTKLLEHYKIPYLFRPSQAHTLKLWERAILEASTREFSSLHSPYVELFFSQLSGDTAVNKSKFQQKDSLLDNWVTGVQHLWLKLADLYEVRNVQRLLDYLTRNQGNVIRDAFISLVLAEKFIAESYSDQSRKSLTVFVRDMQVLSSWDFCLHESKLGLTVDRCLPKALKKESSGDYAILIPLSSDRIISLSDQKDSGHISKDDQIFETYSRLSAAHRLGSVQVAF